MRGTSRPLAEPPLLEIGLLESWLQALRFSSIAQVRIEEKHNRQ
jgi:hypothetical protein